VVTCRKLRWVITVGPWLVHIPRPGLVAVLVEFQSAATLSWTFLLCRSRIIDANENMALSRRQRTPSARPPARGQ
jgi:hypothetical protein